MGDVTSVSKGVLAFTSDADREAGQAAMTGGPESAMGVNASVSPLPIPERVELLNGVGKYACVRATSSEGSSFLAVRSGPEPYHADVARPLMQHLQARGYRCEALGGGRIAASFSEKKVHIYGYLPPLSCTRHRRSRLRRLF